MACDLCIHSIGCCYVAVESGDGVDCSGDVVALPRKRPIDKPVSIRLHNIRKRTMVGMEMGRGRDSKIGAAAVEREIQCVASVWAAQLNDVIEPRSQVCATEVWKLCFHHCMSCFVPSTMFQRLYGKKPKSRYDRRVRDREISQTCVCTVCKIIRYHFVFGIVE